MQSSAKRRRLDLTDDRISLIYNKNRTGPKTEPCGTPERTGFEEDCVPFIKTDCELFDRKALIYLSIFPLMP